MPNFERKTIRCTVRRKQSQTSSKETNMRNTFVLTACHLVGHQRQDVVLAG